MRVKPLAIDLFCGLGGWADGFLSEGWDVIGFDVERHDYGTGGYPGQLVVQDVLTLDGRQFRKAAVIVASPPCQEFSYMAMPWSRAKQIARALRGEDEFPEGYTGSRTVEQLRALFDACFRIAGEAGIPLAVENVKGAQPWVGSARAHFGSFYFWGDIGSVGGAVAAAVPKFGQVIRAQRTRKNGVLGGSWFPQGNGATIEGKPGRSFQSVAVEGTKNPGMSWSGSDKPGYVPQGLNTRAAQKLRDDFGWSKDSPLRNTNSHSHSRKAASAQIAKIPLPLAQHIARVFKP